MVLEPNGIHTVSSYTFRKTWDCLVRHLLELEPPKDFRIVSAMERTEEYVQKFLDDNPHIEMAQT